MPVDLILHWGGLLQRHVGVLLPGILLLLAGEEFEVLADSPPRRPRLDDVVHVAPDGRREGVGELFHVLLLLRLATLA